jgi:preprotein translocase subunit SecE
VAKTSNVTRITAKDEATKPQKAAKVVTPKAVKASTKKSKAPKAARQPKNWFEKMLFGIGGYFKGAWVELRQVRWPNRKATWALTLAVLLFSAFFVVLILLLDTLFKYIFELIIA